MTHKNFMLKRTKTDSREERAEDFMEQAAIEKMMKIARNLENIALNIYEQDEDEDENEEAICEYL